ncbi:hypothetical protein GDO86_007147 [Hymenochirus boettgeri]|uniref:STAS domain-containing protein n=1 Tax=Hymenochirus boettgeri TaxID=247094 RepID=A0A8T2ISL8_9PIPI|nr:hypothetical protein GDO86_007147 [Hymenochirus boettgeri]
MTGDTEIYQKVERYCTKRHVLSQAELEEIAAKSEVEKPPLWSELKSRTRCSAETGKSLLMKYLPIVRWLPRYSFKEWIMGDIISGISVGIMHLPQGLAYALLAGLPPVFGLYTSFYPVFIYFLLGTSKHISIGTFAVVSIMISGVTETLAPYGNFTVGQNASIIETAAVEHTRVELAASLAFLVGLFQIGLGLLQFGFVVTYLSEPLIRGYTTASAVIVLVSQLKYLLGIHLTPKMQLFSVIYILIDIFSRITQTNVGALIVSLTAIGILLAMKFLNEKLASRLPIPIPAELIVLIVSTGISYGVRLHDRFGVENVGNIPAGLQAPVVPKFNQMGEMVGTAFAIAIVAFTISISLGKVLASNHGYKVDSNQELIALGVGNTFGCFFQCFATSTSLSRSLVQESTGGKTQVSSAVSTLVILIFILRAGELFQDLPKAILAAVVVVNLRGMFRQFWDIQLLWKTNRIDLLVWLVTFLSTVILSMDIGLGVSVAFSLLTVIFRTQLSNYSVLGQVSGIGIYRDVTKYQKTKEVPGIKIFHSSSTVYFANAELYLEALKTKCGIDVEKLIEKKRKALKKQNKTIEKAKKDAMKNSDLTNEASFQKYRYQRNSIFPVNREWDIDSLKVGLCSESPVVIVTKQAKHEEQNGTISLHSLGLERPVFRSLILDLSSFNFVDSACVKIFKKVCGPCSHNINSISNVVMGIRTWCF